ncbi:MAG: phosphatase PAP2 family protein [Clostridia bacterium]|nr:phosphatase PAP2 family protein [Clostridia bacterium]
MFGGEITILQWLEQFRSPFWNGFWETVTLFGEDILFIFLIAALYFLYHKKTAYRICFLMATSLLTNGILKNIIKLPRPFADGKVSCVRPETATGYSFPSGHTQTVTTWSVLLADYFGKKVYLILAAAVSVLVGFSRMFLGAHYLSDVVFSLFLGSLIAILGNRIYDKASNHHTLYLGALVLFTPFFVWFLIAPDPHFEDFFKCFGLLGGFLVSVKLEETYVNLNESVSFLKKVLRMLLGVFLALMLKGALSLIAVPQALRMSLLWDSLCYFVLVFLIFGIYPLLLKKLNW